MRRANKMRTSTVLDLMVNPRDKWQRSQGPPQLAVQGRQQGPLRRIRVPPVRQLMRIDSESDDWLIAWDLYWNSLLFRAGGRGFGFGSLREEERLGEPMTEPEPVDESGSREPMKWLYSYGGHVRTAAERALGERLHPAKDLRKPGSRREWQREPKKHGRGGSPEETEEGWVTPRCSRTSMQGLRVLSNSAVLREDVSQRMTAVVQGKDPLIDDITLNSITMSADELAALDTTEQADCLDDLGRQEMSVRVEDSVVSWPEPEAKVQHRVSGYEYPDCRPSGRNAASLRETYSEHPESIGSQALRGGRSSQLKYIVTSQQIEQQKKLQRDLEHKVDIAHAHLNQSIQSTEEVDGVKSQNWDKMCASKARDLDQHVRLQRQRQAVIRDNTTVRARASRKPTVCAVPVPQFC